MRDKLQSSDEERTRLFRRVRHEMRNHFRGFAGIRVTRIVGAFVGGDSGFEASLGINGCSVQLEYRQRNSAIHR